MIQKYRSIRATIEGQELIERYESYKFENDLNDREIITMALIEFLNERENEQCL
jgi:hypothetical protein